MKTAVYCIMTRNSKHKCNNNKQTRTSQPRSFASNQSGHCAPGNGKLILCVLIGCCCVLFITSQYELNDSDTLTLTQTDKKNIETTSQRRSFATSARINLHNATLDLRRNSELILHSHTGTARSDEPLYAPSCSQPPSGAAQHAARRNDSSKRRAAADTAPLRL